MDASVCVCVGMGMGENECGKSNTLFYLFMANIRYIRPSFNHNSP